MRWSGQAHGYPPDEPAQGVVRHAAGDSLAIDAEGAGWVWVRVPWDPYWASASGAPVLKGGPGYLVVWANRGTTELWWSVPGTVDAAAAAVTGVALLSAAGLSIINRRRGWDPEPERSRPAAAASDVFAVTVDGWISSGARKTRDAVTRSAPRMRGTKL